MAESQGDPGEWGVGGKPVITPGGPRRPEMVHRVGPGQAVYPDRQGGFVVSEQLVLTPGGFRPKSFVNFIEPGYGLILDQGIMRKIDLATRRVIDLPAPPALGVAFGAFGPGRTPLAPPATGEAAPSAQPGTLPDGWQTYAWWDSGASTPITSFVTTWTVPQAPSTNSGQVVFLFNGIQNTGQDLGILQPVLQWGVSAAGGGNVWSVASWYVTSGGQAFHTTLVPVSTGTVLVGRMTQTGSAGGLFNYSSAFQGIPNTTLPILNIAGHHWARRNARVLWNQPVLGFPRVERHGDVGHRHPSPEPPIRTWRGHRSIT